MTSLDQHLDQQQLQKLLREVIHHTRAFMDNTAPDHQALANVILRQVSYTGPCLVIWVVHDGNPVPKPLFEGFVDGVRLGPSFKKQALSSNSANRFQDSDPLLDLKHSTKTHRVHTEKADSMNAMHNAPYAIQQLHC